MASKTIDFLFEDPPINGQMYALVSIVGPHMPQKCNVWGLKVRGVTNTLEQAKEMTAKLMKVDNNYDIYTVEVGKFFPLAVEPLQLKDVEYQNEALNSLIKQYLENREQANEQWHARKNEMIQEAIKEGALKNRDKPEHPVAVLGRMKNLDEKINDLREQLTETLASKTAAEEKFAAYSEEEKEFAKRELESAVKNANDSGVPSTSSITEIQGELSNEKPDDSDNLTPKRKGESEVEKIIEEIRVLEIECADLRAVQGKPVIQKTLKQYEEKIEEYKRKLENVQKVNQFINSNYNDSVHDSLFN